jgi:hypothetical protein
MNRFHIKAVITAQKRQRVSAGRGPMARNDGFGDTLIQ